jgi:hypothetical protein
MWGEIPKKQLQYKLEIAAFKWLYGDFVVW